MTQSGHSNTIDEYPPSGGKVGVTSRNICSCPEGDAILELSNISVATACYASGAAVLLIAFGPAISKTCIAI
jgi:hypothetical protein